jgi:hypothetical protein
MDRATKTPMPDIVCCGKQVLVNGDAVVTTDNPVRVCLDIKKAIRAHLDTVQIEYEQRYLELVNAMCSPSWGPRDNHDMVLKLAARLRDSQSRIYANENPS